MQIDWITVVAQVVNFLILVWLLQHFLYGPVVRAMDRRERHIGERLEEAAEKERAAEEGKAAYEREKQDLEHKRDELLEQARQDAEARRKELEEDARQAADALRSELHEHVEQERERFLRDLRQHIAERFEDLARQALTSLADAKLEQQIAETFCRQIDALDAQAREEISESALQADQRLAILSSHPLPADVRRSLTRRLHETFGDELEVVYRQNDSLTCGLELNAGSHSVFWSLDAFLDDFEARMTETLNEMAARIQPAQNAGGTAS